MGFQRIANKRAFTILKCQHCSMSKTRTALEWGPIISKWHSLMCIVTSLLFAREFFFTYKCKLRIPHVKFIYSEKATKSCEIFTLLLYTVHTDKSKVKIFQNFVAFSEYMNFNVIHVIHFLLIRPSNSPRNEIIPSETDPRPKARQYSYRGFYIWLLKLPVCALG